MKLWPFILLLIPTVASADALSYGPVLGRGVTGDRMIVKWGLASSTSQSGQISYQPIGSSTPATASATPTCSGGKCDYQVELSGLQTATQYQYTVSAGSATSSANQFGTCPLPGAPMDLVFYGDSRSYPAEHAKIVALVVKRSPDMVFESGDVVVDGTYNLYLSEFMTVAKDLVAQVPFMAAPGNHDSNQLTGSSALSYMQTNYGRLFAAPQTAMNAAWAPYYSFTCGNGMFISLNSNDVTNADQKTFVTNQLAAAKADASIDHVFVWFHYPVYSSGMHGDNANVISEWQPMFDDPQNKVTMVVTGHDHFYERLTNGSHVTYIVTGGGGSELYGATGSSAATKLAVSVSHHYLLAHVVGKTITVNTFDDNDTTIDSWVTTAAGASTTGLTCPHEFDYAGTSGTPLNGTEKTIEVHGSFDGWGSGAALTHSGSAWSTTLTLPANTRVAYKFRVVYNDNSEKWFADPNDSVNESDGLGGMNSVITGVTCGSNGDGGTLTDGGTPVGDASASMTDGGGPITNPIYGDGGLGDGGTRPKTEPASACSVGPNAPTPTWLLVVGVALALAFRRRILRRRS